MIKGLKAVCIRFICTVLAVGCSALFAQPQSSPISPDLALPYMRVYSLEEYGQQPQNWAISQDEAGYIFVANQGGALRYDGLSWEGIAIPNTFANSLIFDGQQVIVGGYKTIGQLCPSLGGPTRYEPLAKQPPIDQVYRMHRHSQQIIVQAKNGFYTLGKGSMNRWLPNLAIRRVMTEGAHLYFQTLTGELYELIGELPHLIAALDPQREVIIWLTELSKGHYLLASHQRGLILLDDKEKKSIDSDIGIYLSQNTIIEGLRLANKDIALATFNGGLVILDADLQKKWLITKQSGLPSNTIRCLFEDREQNLWLGLDYGLCKLEIHSPFLHYGQASGVPEMAQSVTTQGQQIWLGTSTGLFIGSDKTPFRAVTTLRTFTWDLESTPFGVLCASSSGLYLVNSQEQIRQLSAIPLYVLEQDPNEANSWFAASDDRVYRLSYQQNNWQISPLGHWQISLCRSLVALDNGELWCGSEGNGLWRIKKDPDSGDWCPTHYQNKQGIGSQVRVFKVGDKLWLVSERKLLHYQPQTDSFQTNTALGIECSNGNQPIFILEESPQKDLWAEIQNRLIQFVLQSDAIFKKNKTPFLRLPPHQINQIHFRGRDVFMATIDGLLGYSPQAEPPSTAFHCRINSIRLGQVLFKEGTSTNLQVEFKHRDLEVQASALFYQNEAANQFQFFLQGFDADWTPWQNSPSCRYTNLPPGAYTLRVRAKNIFETISSEDRFTFSILPPWYLSWWALLGYLMLFGLFLWGIIHWRTQHLMAEKQALESLVTVRTQEIRAQKDQLAGQTEKLKELDQLKSRFFANISHEFRTPLTLISGPVDSLLGRISDPMATKTLKNVQYQADRLLDLVNQLLELARFESGQMELKRNPIELLALLKGLLCSFESLAEQKQIQLHFKAGLDALPVTLDQEKTERLIVNLIANALKFTPDGGRVLLEVCIAAKAIEIVISDTGIGIPEDKIEHIFERFYRVGQVSGTPGSGIGLSLAREIVEGHQGKIWAENIPGGGSRFIVRLPWIRPSEQELASSPAFTGLPLLEPDPTNEEDKHEVVPADKQRDLILVVEDNADVSAYILSVLRESYRVVRAANGQEGVEKAREFLPDLIVCDVMMPIMDGWQLCATLKQEVATSHIPIILLTARGGEESQLQGYELGADDYITKPFRPQLLLARIKNLIKQRSELQKKLRLHFLTEPQEISVNSTDEKFLREVSYLLEAHYSDPLFHVEALQQKLLMGRTTLYRKLLALTGEAPSLFLRSFRLARGAQLLGKGHGNVTEVSQAVGFTNPAYFSECFKQKYGVNPSHYPPH